MDGFVELDSDEGHGRGWVRVAHVTGIRVLEVRDGNGATFHPVPVLAGLVPADGAIVRFANRLREIARARGDQM